jgi:hypothetical protein
MQIIDQFFFPGLDHFRWYAIFIRGFAGGETVDSPAEIEFEVMLYPRFHLLPPFGYILPDLVFNGTLLVVDRPVVCLKPAYMPPVFPWSGSACILWLS